MDKIIKEIFCLIVFFHISLCDKKISSEIEKVLKMYQGSGYNKDVRPDYGGQPILVNISMHINDISSVSEVDMDFTADLFLRQTWNDQRLTFNQTEGLKQLIVGADFIKKIWIPDTFFANSKQSSLHTSTNLETNSFLRIKPNGDVYYSLRVTVVSVCQMDLKFFPFDSQVCKIEIESYGYSTDDFDYLWMEKKGTTFEPDIILPNFDIVGHSNEKKVQAISTGNYSRLSHRIAFSRSLGYYFNQVYIPAILIVIISWIPFWLDRDDSHARVGLGVTTVLTMTTLLTNTNSSMPKISYMTSLDIYLEVCFSMVFASLIQYAIVGYFISKSTPKVTNCDKITYNVKNANDVNHKRNPSKIDVQSRWTFPLIFTVFNVFYWSIYLYISRINFCTELNKK